MQKLEKLNKFIFLDRDGVINIEKKHLHKKSDMEIIPRSAEAIKILNDNDYKVIIITNQPVIARGLCTLEELEDIHKHMKNLMAKKGAKLDKIYFCPHHPKEGDNPIYTKECECRKPKAGMILKAQKDFNIGDLSECFMIGDKMSDIYAGQTAGCKTILVETGYGGCENENLKDIEASFRALDLYEAVIKIILKR